MRRHRAKTPRTEVHCPECEGTGFTRVTQPSEPGRKIYPASCKQCLGKGRISSEDMLRVAGNDNTEEREAAPTIGIRPAGMSDAELLLEWRNDPLMRAMARSAEVIERQTHVAWLSQRLARPTPALFIAEIDGLPVGSFRIDDGDVICYVAADWRGKGIGGAMLKAANTEYGPLRAVIFERNTAAIRAARSAGIEVVTVD